MLCGQLLFSNNAIETSDSYLGLLSELSYFGPSSVKCIVFHFLKHACSFVFSHWLWSLINWLFGPVSLSEPLCSPALLFCSAICTHWKSKQPSLSVHRFLSCSLFRSFRSVVRHVNSIGQKNNGSRRQHSMCHILSAGSFMWETCTKQLHLKSWIACLRKAATWTDVQHSCAQFYLIAALQEVRLLSPKSSLGKCSAIKVLTWREQTGQVHQSGG